MRIPPLLLGAVFVGASIFVATAPATAHDALVSSTPSAGDTLTELPQAFSVTMNEELLDLEGEGSGFGLLVRDAEGLYYGEGCVSVDGATMSADAVIGAPGEYTVIWQVVSGDGHPVSDEFTFTWAPTDDLEATSGTSEPGDCNGTYARDDHEGAEDHEEDSGNPGLGGLVVAAVVIAAAAIAAIVLLLRRRPAAN